MKLKLQIALLLLVTKLYAQEPSSPVTEIKIGDKVPDIYIGHISNYKNHFAMFSEFKGKLVILDFWGVDCVGCLRKLPFLAEMQKKYKEQIQVLLINSSSKRFLDSVIRLRHLTSRNFDVPLLTQITSDSILQIFFPHTLIPHYVWIGKDERVIAITGSYEINEENIKDEIDGKSIFLNEKKDFLSFNSDSSILPQIFSSRQNNLKYYSALIRYVPGLGGRTNRLCIDSINKTMRVSRGNYSILEFYGDALTQFRSGNPFESYYFDFGKRVILNVKDSDRYFFKSNSKMSSEEWNQKYRYSYETILPLKNDTVAYQTYLTDLNKFFGIDGRIVKRKMRCLAIIRTSKKDKLKFRGGKYLQAGYTDPNGMFHLYGLGLMAFRNQLSKVNRDKPYVFVDDTGYKGMVRLEIKSSLDDLAALKNELRKKYDLDLVETDQYVDVMILTESRNSKTN